MQQSAMFLCVFQKSCVEALERSNLSLSRGPSLLTCNMTLGKVSWWPPVLASYSLAVKTGMTPIVDAFLQPVRKVLRSA